MSRSACVAECSIGRPGPEVPSVVRTCRYGGVRAFAWIGIAGGLAGCSAGGRGDLTIRESGGDRALVPAFSTVVYTSPDQNTADVYLTDLPLERVGDPVDPLRDVEGSVVHIHIFLVPHAGRTPIDPSACNASVRHAVMAGGVAGLYGGGGFVYPDGRPGRPAFSADVSEATLRLLRASPGFTDRLHTAVISGGFSARKDEAAAGAIAQRLQQLIGELPQVEGVPGDRAAGAPVSGSTTSVR